MTPRIPTTDPSSTGAPPTEGLARIERDRPGWDAVTVEHLDGERYAIGVRGHMIVVDQTLADGGSDTAATPTELLIASLASCVAFYAGRFMDRHGYSRHGLRVTASFTMSADRPARVASIEMAVHAPSVPVERHPAMQAVVARCTVHNTLRTTPQIDITIS